MIQPTDTPWNDADDELLSAYVDNDLADAERVALEARLQREPVLQAALDDLRATVTLLHDLPQLVPPRAFTLDPAAHRSRWQLWTAWLWRSSALAAVLLALTFTLDFVGTNGAPTASSGGTVSQSAAAPTTAAFDDSSARSAESAPAAAAPMMAPAPTMEVLAATSAAASMPAATPADAAASADNTGSGAAGAPSVAEAPAAPEASSAQQALSPADATASAESSAASAAMPSKLTQSGEITNSGSSSPGTAALKTAPAPAEQTTVQPIQPASRRLVSLRVVQIVLAVLVVLLAGAALWVARRRA